MSRVHKRRYREHSPESMTQSKRMRGPGSANTSFSEAEREILRRAASILRVPVQDLPSSLSASRVSLSNDTPQSESSGQAGANDTLTNLSGIQHMFPFEAGHFGSLALEGPPSVPDTYARTSQGVRLQDQPSDQTVQTILSSLPPVETPNNDRATGVMQPVFGAEEHTASLRDNNSPDMSPSWIMSRIATDFLTDAAGAEFVLPSSNSNECSDPLYYDLAALDSSSTEPRHSGDWSILLGGNSSPDLARRPSLSESSQERWEVIGEEDLLENLETLQHSHSSADMIRPSATPPKPRGRKLRTFSNRSGSGLPCRGPFRNPQERLETGQTRILGACIRCRMQHIRCVTDPTNLRGPCRTCQRVAGPTLSRLPCLRYKISDSSLVPREEHPSFTWSQRWLSMEVEEITCWRSPQTKTIEITQYLGGKSYQVQVREFVPVEGDSLIRKWKTRGAQKLYQCAPYAIVDMEKTGRVMMQYVNENIAAAIESEIDDTDKLLWNSYAMAYRYSQFAERAKERSLLQNTLRLWLAIRMSTRSEWICSDETLGMEPQTEDKDAPNFGKIPIPPVMGAQIEVISHSLVLQPLKQAVLSSLQSLVQANKTRSWFTIYLCMFVLLHSCALITNFHNAHARKHGLEARFAMADLVEELHNGARTLLAYFHYSNKGARPFILDWTSAETVAMAELNSEQVQFVKETAQMIKDRDAKFTDVRANGEFEHDYYFASQLYDLDWKPTPTI